MKSFFLPTLVLASLATSVVAEPKASDIGEGTVILYDAGYYPQKGSPWVSIPTRLRVIGYYEPKPDLLVCVGENDQPPYDGFFLINKSLRNDGGGKKPKVLKLRRGELSPMDDSDVSVSIRE